MRSAKSHLSLQYCGQLFTSMKFLVFVGIAVFLLVSSKLYVEHHLLKSVLKLPPPLKTWKSIEPGRTGRAKNEALHSALLTHRYRDVDGMVAALEWGRSRGYGRFLSFCDNTPEPGLGSFILNFGFRKTDKETFCRELKMQIFRDYAFSFIGLPYKYGGDDPIKGFDCSGLVIELYQSLGLIPHKWDGNAQSIYDKFATSSMDNAYGLGSLVFYGQSVTKITHVALMLENSAPWRILEAGGGTSQTVDSEVASINNAFIRIRPYDHRKDKVAILRPLYFSGK